MGKTMTMIPFRRTAAILVSGTLVVTATVSCGREAGDALGSLGTVNCLDESGDTVKIGSVNSLTGGSAASETVIYDAIRMAVSEINDSGGVIGKKLSLISEDGASDPAIFAQKSQKLISSDCVAAVFGGYTSASRKAMLPIFERTGNLLYYGQQYEGLEESPNIFYTGATTNQQIIPALDYIREKGARSLYLVGSDYVFPRTANAIVKEYAKKYGMDVKGEDYVPLGGTDFATVVNKIRGSNADAIFNVVVGDSLVSFYREYANVGLTAEEMPTISMAVGEEEVKSIGGASIAGQFTSWNYYQSLDTPENRRFVEDFQRRYGVERVTSDPMESAYTAVYLWKEMVEQARTFDPHRVVGATKDITVDSPEGTVRLDGENHHVTKTARIGEIRSDGQIDQVWQSDGPIVPDPYLDSYDWAAAIQRR